VRGVEEGTVLRKNEYEKRDRKNLFSYEGGERWKTTRERGKCS